MAHHYVEMRSFGYGIQTLGSFVYTLDTGAWRG